MILPMALAVPVNVGNNVLGILTAITPQLPRKTIHGLEGGSDGMDCGYESLCDVKAVTDDFGQGS